MKSFYLENCEGKIPLEHCQEIFNKVKFSASAKTSYSRGDGHPESFFFSKLMEAADKL